MSNEAGTWITIAKVSGLAAISLAVWRASATWTKMRSDVDMLLAAYLADGKMGLKRRQVIEVNSPATLGDAVSEALEKGISDDMLDFFRSASKGKLPQRDTDVWKMVVKKFGHDRLAMGCDELGWQMNEYMVWWITGLRNPEVVEEVLRRKSK